MFIKITVPAGIGFLALTITVDSYFWNRILWPEGEGLWFNTIQNKSSEWGTSPFLWYFYSALPRAMGLSLVFVPIGIYYESRIRAIAIPALVFVFLYSFLPHKELRFIIYVFPLLNIAAACACHKLWISRTKSVFRAVLATFAGAHLLVNIILTIFLLLISGTNYPGGIAMSRLHRIAANETNVSVHISNLAAQSGVSRFTKINSNWTYSKEEQLEPGDQKLHNFTYLLIESRSKYSAEMKLYQHTHDVVEFVDCFSSIGLQYQSLFPVKVKTKPCVGILRRRWNANDMLFMLPDRIDRKNIADEKQIIFDYFNATEPPLINHSDAVEPKLEIEDDIDLIKEMTEIDEPEFFAEKPEIVQHEEQATQSKEILINDRREEIGKIEEIEKILEPEKILENEKIVDNVVASKEIHSKLRENVEQNRKSTGHSARSKLKELIESHYRSRGSIIEFDKVPTQTGATMTTTHQFSAKSNIKRIIKSAKIMELVDRISKLNLNDYCDLELLETKECLKKIIDDFDVTSEKL